MQNQPKLSLLIRRKDRILFTGPVKAVSSTNELGPFDVLPYHSNLVATIAKFVRIYLDNNLIRDFEIPKGVMHVKENKVEVYVGA